METAELGDGVLDFPIDVNENEEAVTSYGSHVDCNIIAKSHPFNDNRSRPCTVENGQAGYVYIASKGKNTIVDCVVLPSHEVRVGNTIMLDLVTEFLPSQSHESCVISDLCNDHRCNGFIDADRRALSSPDTATSAYRQEGNRMLLQLGHVSERGEFRDCVGDTRDLNSDKLNMGDSNPGPLIPSLSCSDNLEQSCTCTTPGDSDMKISNSETDYLSSDDWSTDVDTDYCSQVDTHKLLCQDIDQLYFSVKEVNVANDGLHIANAEATSACVAVSSNVPLNEVAFNPQLQNIESPPSCKRNSGGLRHGDTEEVLAAAKTLNAGSDVLNPEDVPSESSAKLQSPCLSTLSEHISITEPSTREDLSECSLPTRPLNLRTDPHITVTLSCDATPLSPEDGDMFFRDEGCIDCRRQSAPEKLPDGLTSLPSSSKKFGISEFFTRSLFSRKPKEPKSPSQVGPGWKLFGKVSVREKTDIETKDNFTIQQECSLKERSSTRPQAQVSVTRRKNLEFEPLSTTALILEDRPPNLPAKSVEEALRHKQEYDEMVAGAKRREMKEAQRKKRQMKERFKQEDSIANAMIIWNNDILPNWNCMRNTRRVRELWWQGLPPSIRGRVWSLAIGNELNITPELYEIFLSRAKERWRCFNETILDNDVQDLGSLQADRESSLDLIKLDISRTFPSLFIFQKGGPYHDLLHSVLGAYTCYRPDVGYGPTVLKLPNCSLKLKSRSGSQFHCVFSLQPSNQSKERDRAGSATDVSQS
ncbi:TBC1 domain family member 14 isoform X2 [Esox lucius]|uniref:TBC1 domain family member 14 isoform X2 n=1 Tax=Esox lucius TaxID=8010 RepID=UPI0010BD94E5|nr:TBC1 domain family member 14 isoform X2 [Esox lucius]